MEDHDPDFTPEEAQAAWERMDVMTVEELRERAAERAGEADDWATRAEQAERAGEDADADRMRRLARSAHELSALFNRKADEREAR
jgi:hypothetical protein